MADASYERQTNMKETKQKIASADLKVTLDNGTQLVFSLSPAQMNLFVKENGIIIRDIRTDEFVFYRFSGETTTCAIFPLLPPNPITHHA